jgi:hypothetical protein
MKTYLINKTRSLKSIQSHKDEAATIILVVYVLCLLDSIFNTYHDLWKVETTASRLPQITKPAILYALYLDNT